MSRIYTKRQPGDIVKGATLINRINHQLWEMRCPCGENFVAQPSDTSGLCRKCSRKALGNKMRIHGESPRESSRASRLYNIWNGMKFRCETKKSAKGKGYADRGIKICEEWQEYLTFKKWALENGYNDNLSLDRIDVDGDYCPGNCRWVDQKTQSNNKRNNHMLTYKGETKTMAEWAEIKGIKYHTLKNRINKYGFTVEEALERPVSYLSRNKQCCNTCAYYVSEPESQLFQKCLKDKEDMTRPPSYWCEDWKQRK